MKKEIIINATANELRVAITEDDRLAEIFLEVADKERHVGSIYLGRVQRVVQGMNAAFIDIGETQDAFLHFSDVGNALDEFKDLLDDDDDDADSESGVEILTDDINDGEQKRKPREKPDGRQAPGDRGRSGPRPQEKGDRDKRGDDKRGDRGRPDRREESRTRAGDRGRTNEPTRTSEPTEQGDESTSQPAEQSPQRETRQGRPPRDKRPEERGREERGREEPGREPGRDEPRREEPGREDKRRKAPQQRDDRQRDRKGRDKETQERAQPEESTAGEIRQQKLPFEGEPEEISGPVSKHLDHADIEGVGEEAQTGSHQQGDETLEGAHTPEERERRRRRRNRRGRRKGRKNTDEEGIEGQAEQTDEKSGQPREQQEPVEKIRKEREPRGIPPRQPEKPHSPAEKGDADSPSAERESPRRDDRRQGRGGRGGDRNRDRTEESRSSRPPDHPEGSHQERPERERPVLSPEEKEAGHPDSPQREEHREGQAPERRRSSRRHGRKKPDPREPKETQSGPAAAPSEEQKPQPRERPIAEAPGDPQQSSSAERGEGSDTPAEGNREGRRHPRNRRGGRGGGRRGGGGGQGPAPSGTIDAKLPTFQTKRSGEVTIALEKGQDVIVQVTRESYASKGVRVSTKVGLPGRFLVLLPLDPSIGISRKVQNMKERRRLRRIAKSILPEGYGCIIRTVAQDKDEELISQDLMRQIDIWRTIEVKLKQVESPALLYKDQSVANTVMRDLFTPDTTRVVIDNKVIFREIRDYVEWAAPALVDKVELYTGNRVIFDEYGVERELEKMFQRKIYIPSGGYIIMDQTEAMMVIDVNSGRYAGNKEQELNALRTNLESAREIARQIRLRDIGGLLVVDFIDLYDEKNRKKVYDELKKEMRKDRAKSVVLPMTQFGLVQMTRQRIRQQILQTISEPCPTCSGSGLVQSKSTVMRRIERWLKGFKENSREFRLTLTAHPSIIDYLTEGAVSRLTKLMLKYFVRVKVVPDESLAVHEFHFFSIRQQSDITEKYMVKD